LVRRHFTWLELIWADGGYNAWQVDAAVAKVPRLRLAIVKRSDDMKGFVVLPRRWVVERTFSWFGRNRRLAKDFENLAETLGAFVALASIQLLPSGGLPGRRSPTQQTAGLHGAVVKVCKSDREGTVAGTRGNGRDAP
jgi:transposase